jgi:hypothetical protein
MSNFIKAECNADFQRACGDFVARHVQQCASSFIYSLAQSDEAQSALEVDGDELQSIMQRAADADDYRDQNDGSVEVIRAIDPSEGKEAFTYNHDGEPSGDYYDDELEAWLDAYEASGQDQPNGAECYEHWMITRDLSYWLEKRGESVSRDIVGFCIWGRCTSGQAISIDHVIASIVWDFASDDERKAWTDKA